MALHLAGYFPKRIALRDEWLKAPAVREVWSVSECISEGPPDWVSQWRHNDVWLFDTPELAESVVPPGERGLYVVLGYRIWDRMFDEGDELELDEDLPRLEEPAAGFESVGFDAVARLGTRNFGCSPLSCNGGAETFATNERCLFRTFDEAVAGAKAFSSGNWEPGPYWVVEVLAPR
jgi:hypothetical protein